MISSFLRSDRPLRSVVDARRCFYVALIAAGREFVKTLTKNYLTVIKAGLVNTGIDCVAAASTLGSK